MGDVPAIGRRRTRADAGSGSVRSTSPWQRSSGTGLRALALATLLVFSVVSLGVSGPVGTVAAANTSTDSGPGWAQNQFDDGRTGHTDTTTGPTGPVETNWTHQLTSDANPRPASPVVADGRVYVGADDGNVSAHHASNGTEIWTANISNPREIVSLTLSENALYVSGRDNVFALDPETGGTLWAQPFSLDAGNGERNAGTAIVEHDGRLYVGVGFFDTGYLYALNATTGTEDWRYQTNTGIWYGGVAVSNGTVYVADGRDPTTGPIDGGLYAVNATLGAEEWTTDYATRVMASPTVADGTVYVGTEEGDLYAYDETTGNERWNVTMAGDIVKSPAVANGVVYVGTEQPAEVHALDADTGDPAWAGPVALAGDAASPIVVDGTVYAAGGAEITALDAATGAERFTQALSFGTPSTPAVLDGRLYVTVGSVGYLEAITDVSSSDPASFAVTVAATNSPVDEGEGLDVTVDVQNTGDQTGTQDVTLTVDGVQRDVQSVTLAGGASQQITLQWATNPGDAGDYTATVASDDTQDTAAVTVAETGATELTDCALIDESGSYVLANDVSTDQTGGGMACIEIVADDVTFDGQGNAVTGGAPIEFRGGNYGILVDGAQNVTVANVTTRDWNELGTGIRFESSSNTTVEDVTSSNNSFGVRIANGSAFTAADSRVAGNQRAGLQVVDSNDGTVRDTVAVDNARLSNWPGVYVRAIWTKTTNVTVENVTVEGSPDGHGIGVASSFRTTLEDVTLADSTAVGNAGTGFLVQSDAVEVAGATARDNEWDFAADVDGTVAVTDLDLGASTAPNTTLTFDATSLRLRGVTSAAANPDAENIGRFFEAESIDAAASLDVSVHYDAGDVTGVDEGTLHLWRESGGEWERVDASVVDTGARRVNATLTDLSTMGVFGESSTASSTPAPVDPPPLPDDSTPMPTPSGTETPTTTQTDEVSPTATPSETETPTATQTEITPTPTATPTPQADVTEGAAKAFGRSDLSTPTPTTTPGASVSNGAAIAYGNSDLDTTPTSTDDVETVTEGAGTPGFGVLVSLLALLGVGLLAVRRSG